MAAIFAFKMTENVFKMAVKVISGFYLTEAVQLTMNVSRKSAIVKPLVLVL